MMFDWIRSKIGGPSGLDAYSQNDLELQAESIKTDMKVAESELADLDQKFREKIQQAAESPATSEDRKMMEAQTIKQNYEQKEAAYQGKLKEYAAMQTLINAKRRLNSSTNSVLQEMDEGELQEFRKEVKRDVLEQNQNLQRIEGVTDTIDETLTAIAGPGASGVDSEVEELVEAAKQGSDLSDISLAEQSETTGEAVSLSDLED
jgi:hypothetical protein